MLKLRSGELKVYIKGLDELELAHDNIMLESCNTSFQVHFQVAPREFARFYNLAQVVSAGGSDAGDGARSETEMALTLKTLEDGQLLSRLQVASPDALSGV